MPFFLRPARDEDVPHILALVNRFAGEDLMLPRTEASVRSSLADWLAAEEDGALIGCGSLVPLTETLVEIRSLAIADGQQGKGVGGQIVLALVQMAQEQGYAQVCALTLRENFFLRLGFELVDRWSISPKVWQACIYCPKFHRCDEVAVLMNLAKEPANSAGAAPQEQKAPAWNSLLRYGEWRPLLLAYQRKPGREE